MQIATILSQIDLEAMTLPEFQRGYVWNREQVRGLMASLYRKYPVGSLLVWGTSKESAHARGGVGGPEGSVDLILDGQQRITSLYGIIRGMPPRFFDGNAEAFTNLYFDLDSETFEFYAPAKMKGKPLWVNVTEVLRDGMQGAVSRVFADTTLTDLAPVYLSRLAAIDAIKTIDLHIEKVAGADKTVDVVVEIFNQVNSGGTKLSKGDLALAKICAQWPAAREEMKNALHRWAEAGFRFGLDWLLRNATTITTGEARFSSLASLGTDQFRHGLGEAEKATNRLLNLISGRLGLDHDRVLGGRYAFPVMTRYLSLRGKFQSQAEQDKLLYWYVHSFLWGRFAGSVETVLNQDLAVVDGSDASLDRLIDQLRRSRGDLRARPEDFGGWSLGARFYPMLYLLTRSAGSRDLAGQYDPLSAFLLGHLSALQVHHIFPKAVLYKHDYRMSEVNAIANFCFLTQEANLEISAREPTDYFAAAESAAPGVLASQWIPDDQRLWHVENYRDFLGARREMLAAAANRFLDKLLQASVGAPLPTPDDLPQAVTLDASEVRDPEIVRALEWVKAQNLPEPDVDLEIIDPATSASIVVADLAWPRGIQAELSDPLMLELGADDATVARVTGIGYRCFTTVDGLIAFVESASIQPSAEAPDVVPLSGVEDRFNQAMIEVYERAKREAGYHAARFLSMVVEVGGLETARRLLRTPFQSDGFTALWEKGRLDLSIEANVLRPEFAELFTEADLEVARRRLADVGYEWRTTA